MQNIVQMGTAAKLYVFFYCCDIGCSFQVFVFRQRVACLKILSCVFLSELTLIKAIIHVCFQSCQLPFFYVKYHYIFQMNVVIKGFVADGLGVSCVAKYSKMAISLLYTNKQEKKIEDTSVETRAGAKSTVISGALHAFIIVQKNPCSHKTLVLNKRVVMPFLL